MKEAFFYYTTILALESISYWIRCCEQTLGNQQIQEGRVGFAQTSRVESVYPDREHMATEACWSLRTLLGITEKEFQELKRGSMKPQA